MHKQHVVHPLSGWVMLAVNIAAVIAVIAIFIIGVRTVNGAGARPVPPAGPALMIIATLGFALTILSFRGHFIVQPNHARVLILFGKYKGTVLDPGFHWANPFLTRTLVSQRLRNLEGAHLKVNDRQGNPIEIAAVVVWKVADTAQAVFDVDDYSQFVKVQSETAVRHLANSYSYDHGEEHEITLRSNTDEVSVALEKELGERLSKAGVAVEEARLTHLAYAAEIAGAMLRRQQAEAVIAARQKIVQGAVSMVQMALDELAAKQVVTLDDERRAAMVSNLLVVLCGESEVQPVVNTGTLYS